MPKLKEILFGKKDKIKKESTLSKTQKELLEYIKQGLTGGEGPLSGLFGQFNEEEFQKGVADPAIRAYKEEVLPQLLEHYSGGNQAGGSGMRRGLLKAGNELQSKLAELMYTARQQHKQNQLQGLSTATGGQQIQNFYRQGDEGLVAGLAKGAGEKAAKAITSGVVVG